MKIFLRITVLASILFSCQKNEINFNPKNNIYIEVPEVLKPQDSNNDPEQTGISCDSKFQNHNRDFNIITLIGKIEIPDDLPINFDLSENMPPVRSQGAQGSCVAWATAYYLKSYQEKIQHQFDYENFNDVMSPAFVYNQIKSNDDCGSGSSIIDALDLLTNIGCNTWQEFPYSDSSCSNKPTEEQLQIANKNRIKSYFTVGIPEDNTEENYTLTNLIKTLVYQKNPIIISMDFKNLNFIFENDKLIAKSYKNNPTDEGCRHAILIVGYDDQINAFKIVNSWGTNWGNEGYGWISYNFFKEQSNTDYQRGLTGSYIAYDEE